MAKICEIDGAILEGEKSLYDHNKIKSVPDPYISFIEVQLSGLHQGHFIHSVALLSNLILSFQLLWVNRQQIENRTDPSPRLPLGQLISSLSNILLRAVQSLLRSDTVQCKE